MSRIGNKIIKLPKGITVNLDTNKITVKGKHGTLEREFSNIVEVVQENEQLTVIRKNEQKATRAYHGLMRSLIQNMVTGVDELFSKMLIAEGVGYKFAIQGKDVVINVGYSHPITMEIPNDLKVAIESPTKLIVSGIDREKVGFFTAEIRKYRPPEPYKGKGLRYDNEVVRRKVGKTGR